MGNDLRIAVLGCGYWGRNLVRNFYALGVLGVVVYHVYYQLDVGVLF